mgnify:CR=1 FL=1
MKKRVIGIILAGAVCLSSAWAAESEPFPAVNPYPGYADAAEEDWFYDNVKLCYETGLMTGTDLGFEPQRVLTVGEVTAVAARMNEAITGESIPVDISGPGETAPWYQRYVDYLERLGVSVPDGVKEATRMEFVSLLYLPCIRENAGEYLAPINPNPGQLPDTDDARVLDFYSAGILTGVDRWGTFAGDETLTRAECAAMVSRLIRPELRLTFTPDDDSSFIAAYLTPDTVMFESGLTAEEFLITINNAIAAWEGALGEEFNWHYVWTDGKTVLEHLKEDSLAALGVTSKEGTQAYQDFDVQVYYSRLIDLTGGPL